MSEEKIKILIVDDRPENRHALGVTLSPLDAEVITAASGNEALALMTRHEFAVVLMDVQMPGMDGFETAELMQNNQATRNIPIIFVTAINKEERHVFKGYRAGAVDYLFKPLNPDILLSKVQVFLNLFKMREDHKKMQQELLKVKNLESLGVLAGGLAHDFNNILGAVLGNINLSLQDRTLSEETREILDDAKKAAGRARILTAQLVTFAKGGEPVRETVALEPLLTEAKDTLLQDMLIECLVSVPETLRTVDIDRNQLLQVIRNIAINGSQAMGGNGVVRIDCSNVAKADLPDALQATADSYVKMEFHDSGTGIAPEYIEKIFDPYFTTKKSGSGLGLAIVHSVVGRHGGHVRVTSQPGEGTTVTVYLPASERETRGAGAEAGERRSVPVVGKGKVMVMDDEDMILKMTGVMLEKLGHEALLVHDGAEAIERYRQAMAIGEAPELTILDLTVPGGMGGQETVAGILAMNPAAKVIVSSGYYNDPIMANYQDYGFCGVIEKPYELEDLTRVLRNFLG